MDNLGDVYGENRLPEGTSRSVLTADERLQVAQWLYDLPTDSFSESFEGFSFRKLWRWCIGCFVGEPSRNNSPYESCGDSSHSEAYFSAAED